MQIFGNEKTEPIHTLITQKDGTYNVGPLDGKVEYRYPRVIPYQRFLFHSFDTYIISDFFFFLFISVTAEKEGFVITGPDSNGVFVAHKLAEIIVQVSDQADNVSLQVRTSID